MDKATFLDKSVIFTSQPAESGSVPAERPKLNVLPQKKFSFFEQDLKA
jgi:hypothetical protein